MKKLNSILLVACFPVLATACFGGPTTNETFQTPGNTGDSREAVAGWKCNTSGGGTQTSKDGTYYATSFGCWLDANGKHRGDGDDNCIPYCIDTVCGDKSGRACEEELKWFTAGERRWGCGTRLQVTNPDNGKSAIVMVIDRGPSCSIEKQVKFWAVDLSYPTTAYLFGEEKGISEKADVKVQVVAAGTPLGPVESSKPPPAPEPDESPAPEGGCGAVTWQGECVGDTVQYCQDDQVKTIDCQAGGGTCGWNSSQDVFDCLAGSQGSAGSQGAPDPGCGAVTVEGACDGDQLRYCDGERVVTVDCASYSLSCGWDSEKKYYDCL